MKIKWYFLLAVAAMFQQCAKQTAPTGGAKDETPPTLIRSNPSHNEVNFKKNTIELVFDEFVQLNNPRELIIITPSVGKNFKTTVKKNKVTLDLNAKLQDTTTYNINFRESIEDATEKNKTTVKLAFSTGPYVDSLFINGSVTNILTGNPTDNYTVALSPANDTFNIFKHPSQWVTQTVKGGKFSLENLKKGNYFLYVFDDKNRNLLVDAKSERYGFKSSIVTLPGLPDTIKLHVFKLDATKLKLIAGRPAFTYYNIRVTKSIVDYSLSVPNSDQKIYSALEKDLTTIKIYNTIPDLDSLQIRLQAIDSSESKLDTLIYLKFQKKESTKDKFTAKIESSKYLESNSTFQATISFSKPVIQLTWDSIFIQVDSLTRINFSKENLVWNKSLTTLAITKKIKPYPAITTNQERGLGEKPKISNQLILARNSAISIENDSISELNSPVQNILAADNGIVHVKVDTKENFILQLLDQTQKVVSETTNTPSHSFENIPAGTYILRLLVDLNKNGKWDAGNFLSKTQPEPVQYYRNPKGAKDVILKANWVVGPLLITW